MKNFVFFDVHSHLHDKAFDEDREVIIESMKIRGVGSITIGTDLKESEKAVELAVKHENIFATIGLHPADNVTEEFNAEEFEKLAQNKKVVAIGECGLDYHYVQTFFERDVKEGKVSRNKDAEVARQKRIFEEQINLAVKVDKPLMLHGRPSKGTMDAYEDMLQILSKAKDKHGEKLRGNAHFFVGNIEIAERFLNIGFTVSFSGVITFAKDYDDVVRFIPLSMMHAETDSPYATPSPFRGKKNTPLFVEEMVAKISILRQEPMEEVRRQLVENAKRVFGV